MAELADYLELTASQARDEFQALLTRRPVPGGRQVVFSPVETPLCLAASFLVNHRHFGGGTAHQAPEPVPSLARLFSRPPSSVLAKMANLDGSRSHGGRWDVLAGALLRDDPARFSRIYRMLLHAALAACPAHDVAFDTGLLTVNGGLRIHVAHSLAGAVQSDPLARQYYGRPPLREVLLLPPGAQLPARRYLDWHRNKVFVA